MIPQRIQRKRNPGWRMPLGAVYVGRPTKWGNPFKVGEPITDTDLFSGVFIGDTPLLRSGLVEDASHAVDLFGFWLAEKVPFNYSELRRVLGGLDLACWCPLSSRCHADVLLMLANGGDR